MAGHMAPSRAGPRKRSSNSSSTTFLSSVPSSP
eukprot:CAMPEP_0179349812 /NCGR_PEP_ID=MMETSP0797-20121207/74431_1 /TAXON_ID=47934 /ORGANISM="Dinophysis acuminata, Strain DAEP01" /LENGTH=32 /DNA_ID= /DNA_START= /DNA_END= /DNA_ORIENTATION=